VKSPRTQARAALGALALTVVATVGLTSPASATGVPFTDPNAKGTITLCDFHGKPITSGSITDRPLAWRAIGSLPVSANERIPGMKATLTSMVPQRGVPAAFWEGDNMTAASSFDTKTWLPAVQATSIDFSIADYFTQKHTLWNGMLQLRIVVMAGGVSPQQYSALTIRVVGDRWTVLGRPGTTPCSAGAAAVSEEIKANGLPASGVVPSTSAVAGSSTPTPSASRGALVNADDPVASGSGSVIPSASGPSGASGSDASSGRSGAAGAEPSGGGAAIPVQAVAIIGILALALGFGASWLYGRRYRH
jgi:hypothetical protein